MANETAETMSLELLSRQLNHLMDKVEKLEPLFSFEPRIMQVEKILFACKEMLTSQEAAYYLGISLSQLYKMTSSMTIPHYKPRGKMVYFDKSELDAWMRRDRVNTVREAIEASSFYNGQQAFTGYGKKNKKK